MDIVLTQGGTQVYIPVLPSEYTISDSQGNQSVTVNAIGEVNLMGKPKLTQVSWSSFFPHEQGSYVDHYDMDPLSYRNVINSMKEGGPVMLHFLDVLAMYCTIESFETSESDGSGDFQYSISLKKYSFIRAEETATASGSEIKVKKGRAVPTTPRSGKVYTVKKGDTLFSIARKQNNSSDWKTIYSNNKSTIGSNPAKIKPGMEIRM
ncbi:MAG: LysM peptidoglycan-binding domain-containing protein [Lachnospiraceae bacterium]|nr:LysM peptidoglycan-binding domain-containing protein [Lachnospiraceae bacterium]